MSRARICVQWAGCKQIHNHMFGEGGRMMSEEIRAEVNPRSPAFPEK